MTGAIDMEQQKLREQIEDFIKGLGGSFAGFSNLGDILPDSLKEYPYAITFGIRLSDAIIDEIEDKPTYTYFNHYRSVNALIDQIGLRTALFIQDMGYKAYTIPASQSIPDAPVPYSAIFPHKTGAVLSGMGWIGKNGLFIHKNFGPRVRLGTVLTNLHLTEFEMYNGVYSGTSNGVRNKVHTGAFNVTFEDLSGISNSSNNSRNSSNSINSDSLNYSNSSSSSSSLKSSNGLNRSQKAEKQPDFKVHFKGIILESKCGTCNKCVQACPAMALTGKTWHIGVKREEIVDAKACSEYMNKNFKHIGRGSVCGICIKVCPFSGD
jgi:ferredoxin